MPFFSVDYVLANRENGPPQCCSVASAKGERTGTRAQWIMMNFPYNFVVITA